MRLCSVGIMGTKYVRDQTLPETLEVWREKSTPLTVTDIYSAFSIGN